MPSEIFDSRVQLVGRAQQRRVGRRPARVRRGPRRRAGSPRAAMPSDFGDAHVLSPLIGRAAVVAGAQDQQLALARRQHAAAEQEAAERQPCAKQLRVAREASGRCCCRRGARRSPGGRACEDRPQLARPTRTPAAAGCAASELLTRRLAAQRRRQRLGSASGARVREAQLAVVELGATEAEDVERVVLVQRATARFDPCLGNWSIERCT